MVGEGAGWGEKQWRSGSNQLEVTKCGMVGLFSLLGLGWVFLIKLNKSG